MRNLVPLLAAGTAAFIAAAATPRPHVARIGRLSRPVADLDRARRFYVAALGLQSIASWTRDDPGFATLLGVPHIRVHGELLAFGTERIQLIACDPPGRPCPPAPANARLFQHAALRVPDIDAALVRLRAYGGHTEITQGGIQTLEGGVRAFKFRDPDGHALELLHLPTSRTPHAGPGIDHSAIAVTSARASLHFWRDLLGLPVTGRSLNQGAAQSALDHLPGPLLRVTQLRPTPRAMGVELLAYASPATIATPIPAPTDIAADRLWLHVTNAELLARRLLRAETPFLSPGLIPFEGRQAMAVRDPDGHILILIE